MAGEIHEAGTSDGWHGVITEDGPFAPQKDRYHPYIGLAFIIPIYIVTPYPRGEENSFPSWIVPDDDDEYPDATPDYLFGSKTPSEIYLKAYSAYTGRYPVPGLWDKEQETIVKNESTEILRFPPTAFDSILDHCPPVASIPLDCYPPELSLVH